MSYSVALRCGCRIYIACDPTTRIAHTCVIEARGRHCRVKRHEIGFTVPFAELPVSQEPTPDPVANPLREFGVSQTEWRALVASRPNLLLQGPNVAVSGAIAVLLPTLRAPIALWCKGMPLVFPADREGTLILRDTDSLPAESQARLLEWIERSSSRRPQVISTTEGRLYALVERHAFLECLYYQLNTVWLDVTTATSRNGPSFAA